MSIISQESLDQLFINARTYNGWLDKDVPDATLKELFDLLKMCPTSTNCSPARFIFLKTKEAKEKLKPVLAPGNVEKTMSAPVVAIIATDYNFHQYLPKLSPHNNAQSWFVDNEPLIKSTAERNGTLQGAYLIMAARSLGLDTGPMSGFNNEMVDELFFKGTSVKSNFLCNIGYGDEKSLYPRSPRFDFDEVCTIQ